MDARCGELLRINHPTGTFGASSLWLLTAYCLLLTSATRGETIKFIQFVKFIQTVRTAIDNE